MYKVVDTQAVLTVNLGLHDISMGNYWAVSKGDPLRIESVMGFFRKKEDAEYICQVLNNANQQLRELAKLVSEKHD